MQSIPPMPRFVGDDRTGARRLKEKLDRASGNLDDVVGECVDGACAD